MKEAEVGALVPLILCLAVAILLSHVVHVKRVFFLTEASVSLLVGLAAGGALLAYYAAFRHDAIPASLVEFNTQIFFDALLPPIIFNAGFSVKKKAFFRNFVTLVLFGVLGTMATSALIFAGVYPLLRALGVGAHLVPDALALGTIFSSSDSVATLQILDQDAVPVLYSLVFGEGVVNDATSIVLLRAVQKISNKSELTADTLALVVLNFMRLFVLSLLLGVAVGLASAFLIRRSFMHHSTDREVSLVALLGFTAYLLAEELGLSGIFSIFFAGLTMSHYTWHALSPSAKVVTVYLFRILSFTSELFLFLYAGFSMWSTTLWQGDIYSRASVVRAAGILAAALVLLVFAARAATLLPLCLLANTWRPPASRISLRQAAVIWWAGSMRGAVTVAMAFQSFGRLGRKEPLDNQLLVVASNAAVTFITVALGAATGPLLARLLPHDETLAPAPTALSVMSLDDGASAPLLSWALQRHLHWNQKSPVYRAWQHIDERWLYPLFGGRAPRGAAAYRSPPCSPGREVIQRVMGPAILKRLGPGSAPQQAAQRGAAADAGDGVRAPPPSYQPPGALAALDGGPTGSLQGAEVPAVPPPPPSSATTVKSGRRHHDAFRLRPAASDGPPQEGKTRGPASASGAPPSLRRTLSTRSGAPEALDMLAEDAVEELFQAGSSRLDSSASQQLDWRDSTQFGEAAWLAAGAPSEPSTGSSDSLAGQLPAGEADGDPEAGGGGQGPRGAVGPPSLSRKSPFQGRG